jgi:hypothetical protein
VRLKSLVLRTTSFNGADGIREALEALAGAGTGLDVIGKVGSDVSLQAATAANSVDTIATRRTTPYTRSLEPERRRTWRSGGT